MTRGRILLVEDEANMARTLAKILERRGHRVAAAHDGAEALERLERESFDLVVTDLNMPVLDGMSLLRAMQERSLDVTTFVLTGHGTIQSAVEAMKLGASDYLIKPCHPDELLLKVEKALELRRLRKEVRSLRLELGRPSRFGELVGRSPAMREIYETIEAVAQNKSNVLVQGEHGTGKELVARAIHAKSPFANRPFVALNCGALADTLLESQLFGHRRGAFTGAVEDHEGVFQAAEGGTLFLDEISEIPLPLQVKFLRAIQEKEVLPLGSTRPVHVDVRIVAATNKNLEEEVSAGRFRTDLYYRLNVVPIRLPPLRERKEDIPLLVEHFVATFSRDYGVRPKEVTPRALERMLEYPWPGNVRELQNVLERAFALSRSPRIDLDDLPAPVRDGLRSAPGSEGLPSLRLDELERAAVAEALRRSGGKQEPGRKAPRHRPPAALPEDPEVRPGVEYTPGPIRFATPKGPGSVPPSEPAVSAISRFAGHVFC